MKRLIAQAMEEGAMGLSTANLIELAAVARQYGGIYSSHIRDEGEGVFRAIEEAIQVGKGAKIVNGQVTIDKGQHTSAVAGRVIDGPGKR